jgi:hypothetical protein
MPNKRRFKSSYWSPVIRFALCKEEQRATTQSKKNIIFLFLRCSLSQTCGMCTNRTSSGGKLCRGFHVFSGLPFLPSIGSWSYFLRTFPRVVRRMTSAKWRNIPNRNLMSGKRDNCHERSNRNKMISRVPENRLSRLQRTLAFVPH